jgi:hypothetical protein
MLSFRCFGTTLGSNTIAEAADRGYYPELTPEITGLLALQPSRGLDMPRRHLCELLYQELK